ncbi:MAG: hypothetical protein RL220_1607 [Bacteroidota bacterium]
MIKVKFAGRETPFYDDLNREVDAYFASHNKKKTGDYRLYLKTFLIMGSMISLYTILVFFTPATPIALVLCGLLGFTLALIGFNIMHDACHMSYSPNATVNEIIGYSMNFLGSNQFLWKLKHNRIHHTYTNIDGVDDDIIKMPILRLCKSQPWKKAHRFQHIYGFFLYGVSSIFWVLITDLQKYFSRDISGTPIKEIPFREHVIFWLTKVFYFSVYIAIPIWMLGFGKFIIGYLVMNFVFGLVLSIVFQLAHAVDVTHFEDGWHHDLNIEDEWAVHQVKTTADFAPRSHIANWLLGGLNFQVVHHLFPNISHVHYREIQPIVERVCARHNVRYNVFNTFPKAVASHVRYIYNLGQAA